MECTSSLPCGFPSRWERKGRRLSKFTTFIPFVHACGPPTWSTFVEISYSKFHFTIISNPINQNGSDSLLITSIPSTIEQLRSENHELIEASPSLGASDSGFSGTDGDVVWRRRGDLWVSGYIQLWRLEFRHRRNIGGTQCDSTTQWRNLLWTSFWEGLWWSSHYRLYR